MAINKDSQDKIDLLCKKDKEDFDFLINSIIQYGLKEIQSKSLTIYKKENEILQHILTKIYSENDVKSMLNNANNVFKLKSEFLNIMKNQNIVSVLKKENITVEKLIFKIKKTLGMKHGM